MDDVPAYLMYVSLFLNSRVVHAVDDMRYVCIRIFRSDPVIVLTNAIAATFNVKSQSLKLS